MRRRLLWTSLLLVALTGAGCASLQALLAGAFKKPTVSFKNAALGGVSLGGATVNLTWLVNNPNPFGLEVAELSYRFNVEGKQVVAGTPPKGLDLRANGRSELEFPAETRFAAPVPVVTTFLTKDAAAYTAEGTVGIRTPIGVLRFPLKHEGTFPVPKMPEVQLESPRITNLTLTGATVEFPLHVTNRNGFALPINGLVGAVNIAGNRVGELSASNIGTLEARGSRKVTLPLKIDFGRAAQAALALRSGRATVGFSGNLQSGGVSLPVNLSQTLSFTR